MRAAALVRVSAGEEVPLFREPAPKVAATVEALYAAERRGRRMATAARVVGGQPADDGPESARGALRAVRDELATLDARRVELLAERDRLVAVARAAGAPWSVLAGWVGISRTALVKRADPGRTPRWWDE